MSRVNLLDAPQSGENRLIVTWYAVNALPNRTERNVVAKKRDDQLPAFAANRSVPNRPPRVLL